MTRNTELSVDELKASIEDLELSISVSKDIFQGMLGSPSLESVFLRTQCLEDEILEAMKSRSEVNGRTLINEQILAEYTNKTTEIQQEFADKLVEIQDQNRRKDQLITQLASKKSKLQKIVETQITDKGLIVVPPSDSVLDMHIRVEKCRDNMQKYARRLQINQKYREALIDKCNEVWEACIKVHALHKNPVNRKQGLDRHSTHCLKPPKRDFSFEFKDEEDSESDEEFLSPQFPVKHTVKATCPINIPSLDFSKLKVNDSKVYKDKNNLKEQALEERCNQIYESIRILKRNLGDYNEALTAVTQENESILKFNEGLTSKCFENSRPKFRSVCHQLDV